jgi:hypothetical protein
MVVRTISSSFNVKGSLKADTTTIVYKHGLPRFFCRFLRNDASDDRVAAR